MSVTGTITGTFETIPDHKMINIEIDEAQYDVLKTQTKSLFDHWNIPFESRWRCTPCYMMINGQFTLASWEFDDVVWLEKESDEYKELQEFLADLRANRPEPVLQYFAKIKLSKYERLEDFAEFEGKQVEVRYRFKCHNNGRDKQFSLRMTGINELQTTEVPPETAAMPEPSAEAVAAAAAAEDTALAPVPLVPAPRPPRRMRTVPPK